MTEAIRTFAKGESVAERFEAGGALYIVTNLAIYRIAGDRLRPLAIAPPEEPPAAASLENVSAQHLGDLMEDAVYSQQPNGVVDIRWFAAAERVITMIKEGVPGLSAEDAARTQVEPGPVTFDPHVGSPLASDGGFVDGMAKMRERNGLT